MLYISNNGFPLQILATALANATVGETGKPHATNITSKSRKRQEIIFLRDDFTHKRNREGETMANIENHGKSLSAEGKVFKGAPKTGNYEDSPAFQEPALKEQSVKKDNGPPEIKENEKKSDAYEVVSDGSDHRNSDSISEEEIGGERVVKVGHPLVRVHTSKGHHRSGLHIVSLDDDDEDNHRNSFQEKDLRLYGSIGSPSPSSVRHKSHRSRSRHTFYQNDYIPPNVVSLSQDDFSGRLAGSDAQTREEIFPNFRRRDPFFFSQPPQLSQPEELMQRFQPVSPKSISYGDRPNMLLLPIYDGRADSNLPLVPMTAQSAFPASPPQFGAAPAEYNSLPSTRGFRNGLLFQPALQVPQEPAQSVSSYMMPSQSDGQFLFNNQQPDIRSLYQLQSQAQMQIPQVPMPQLTQPQQSIIPTEMQMAPELLSAASQREIGPASHWVDEDGRERSEVLDRDTDRQDDDRPNYDRNEDDDDDEARHQSGRYYDRDEDSRADENDDDRAQEDQTSEDQPEQSDSREEEGPSDEEGEETEEPEEPQDESNEDANNRTYGTTGPGEEDEQDEDDNDNQEMEPQHGRFAQQGTLQQFNPRAIPRFMAPTHPIGVPKFPPTLNTMAPTQMDAKAFSRYQLMSPSSALKEQILPEPQEEPKHPLARPHSDLQISQMSTAEAQFYENKAAMEPNFSPPIASKDTIPGKSRRFRFGLGNVLIRLNGKPLEDSSQLRSKIINGQIIQGKGKLIKSKGPVRVKLSHTKDAKHLKIIDILAPTKFHVYDTKSKIRRPSKSLLNDANKTNTKAPFS